MRAGNLDLRELLSFEADGGLLRFAGERALLLDAVALGLVREKLIEVLGLTGRGGEQRGATLCVTSSTAATNPPITAPSFDAAGPCSLLI